jgi:hypothetical protein
METDNEDTHPEQIPPEFFVDFGFSHFPMKHEELTKLLGIKPTLAQNEGEQSKRTTKPFLARFNAWEIKSQIGKDKQVIEHVESLLEILRPKKDIIRSVSAEYGSVMGIVIYCDPNYSECFHIDLQIIKELADMNIALDVHFNHH